MSVVIKPQIKIGSKNSALTVLFILGVYLIDWIMFDHFMYSKLTVVEIIISSMILFYVLISDVLSSPVFELEDKQLRYKESLFSEYSNWYLYTQCTLQVDKTGDLKIIFPDEEWVSITDFFYTKDDMNLLASKWQI